MKKVVLGLLLLALFYLSTPSKTLAQTKPILSPSPTEALMSEDKQMEKVKEAEFNLLTSDKRIYAAQLLADKGKGQLSISTLSKSNNYFHNAVSSAGEAKKMGKDIDTVLHNMKKSIVKHQLVLPMMENVLSKDFASQLRAEGARMVEFERSVDSLILQ